VQGWKGYGREIIIVHEYRKMDRVQRASRNTLTMQIHPQKEWGVHTHTQKSPHFRPNKSILLGYRTSPPSYDLPHLHWTQLKYTKTHINTHTQVDTHRQYIRTKSLLLTLSPESSCFFFLELFLFVFKFFLFSWGVHKERRQTSHFTKVGKNRVGLRGWVKSLHHTDTR
jgi:hypothetical protein